jgi:hypothetical protein
MNVRLTSAVLLLSALVTTPALGQGSTPVLLTPEKPSRWDIAGYTGWRSVENDEEFASSWDHWSDAAVLGVSTGYYWTSHLKAELDVAITTESDLFVQRALPTVTPPFYYQYGNYRRRTISLSGGLAYQFGENAWFHPFVGGGVDVRKDRSSLELQQQPCLGAPCTPFWLPTETVVSYETRPFVAGGFKWYFGERAFVRSDIRAIVSSDGAEAALWRIGIGADF